MTKAEKLDILDIKILDKMIECIDSDDLAGLRDLATPVTYLKANQVVEQARRDEEDPVEKRKAKLEEVRKRRDEQV